MYRILCFAAVCAFCAGSVMAEAPSVTDEAAIEKAFTASLQPNDLRDWMKLMAAEPNQVGSPHDKANAEWELAKFEEFGWDAHIETFQVLYPTPVSEALELKGPKPFKATLQEPPIPGDTSSTAKQYPLPAYLAYQGDGDVTAPLVYEPIQEVGIQFEGHGLVKRLSMMRIIARRMNALTVVA
jgi:N-acetylated-alpha-linked acidic dipeptidase